MADYFADVEWSYVNPLCDLDNASYHKIHDHDIFG